jgi:thioredoxin 1
MASLRAHVSDDERARVASSGGGGGAIQGQARSNALRAPQCPLVERFSSRRVHKRRVAGGKSMAAAAPARPARLPPNLLSVNSDAELREVLASAGAKTVVVDFGAAWCEKCKAVEPVLASLGVQARSASAGACFLAHSQLQFPNMRFVLADADYLPELAADVRYTPTFFVFRAGKKVDEFVGTNQQMLRDRAWLWS